MAVSYRQTARSAMHESHPGCLLPTFQNRRWDAARQNNGTRTCCPSSAVHRAVCQHDRTACSRYQRRGVLRIRYDRTSACGCRCGIFRTLPISRSYEPVFKLLQTYMVRGELLLCCLLVYVIACPSRPSTVVRLLPVNLCTMKMRVQSSHATACSARCGRQVCLCLCTSP